MLKRNKMDLRQITISKTNLIKSIGIGGYLEMFLDHLKAQPGITKAEVFDTYYQVRTETLKQYAL